MCSEEQDMSTQPPPSIEELGSMMGATQEPTKCNKNDPTVDRRMKEHFPLPSGYPQS